MRGLTLTRRLAPWETAQESRTGVEPLPSPIRQFSRDLTVVREAESANHSSQENANSRSPVHAVEESARSGLAPLQAAQDAREGTKATRLAAIASNASRVGTSEAGPWLCRCFAQGPPAPVWGRHCPACGRTESDPQRRLKLAGKREKPGSIMHKALLLTPILRGEDVPWFKIAAGLRKRGWTEKEMLPFLDAQKIRSPDEPGDLSHVARWADKNIKPDRVVARMEAIRRRVMNETEEWVLSGEGDETARAVILGVLDRAVLCGEETIDISVRSLADSTGLDPKSVLRFKNEFPDNPWVQAVAATEEDHRWAKPMTRWRVLCFQNGAITFAYEGMQVKESSRDKALVVSIIVPDWKLIPAPLLRRCGLKLAEEVVYAALPATNREVIQRTGFKASRVSKILAKLERLGLVARTAGRQPVWSHTSKTVIQLAVELDVAGRIKKRRDRHTKQSKDHEDAVQDAKLAEATRSKAARSRKDGAA